MELNVLSLTKDANIQVMTGIVLCESTFSRLDMLKYFALKSCRMSNPYLGQDHVEVMRWFLQKVYNSGLSTVFGMMLLAHLMR